MNKTVKLDQRGYTSAETYARKAVSGRKAKGVSAFVSKRNASREDKLQERIDMIVENASNEPITASAMEGRIRRAKNKYKDGKLSERIELVVANAEESEWTVAGEDVIRHNRRPLLFRTLRAVKIG